MADERLRDSERELLIRAREAIYTNPFRQTPEMLRAQFAGEGEGAPEGHHFSAIGAALESLLVDLDGRGIDRLAAVRGDDRELLTHAFLFQVYHHTVDAMDRHIHDQLAKPAEPLPVPFAAEALAALQRRGFDEAEARRYFALFFQLRRAFYFIEQALVGRSESMRRLRSDLWCAVFSDDARRYDRHLWGRMEDFSTLLLGPTGSGKGAAAAAIGRSGFIPFDPAKGRFAEPFTQSLVEANLSQFAESLIESELFGHRKGAFTGAIDHHKGLLERCSPNGSLFLDEIGDLAPSVQLKLLKVLQERRYTPVGSHEERRFSGRVIAATNRPLDQSRRQGEFRDDFFYRLSSLVIELPTLAERIRERPEELELLVGSLLGRMLGRTDRQLLGELMARLRRDLPPDYPWPGNVRELEQAVRRLLLAGSFAARAEPPPAADDLERLLLEQRPSAGDLLARYCRALYAQSGNYEEVARRTGLDRRTVKKYLNSEA